MYIVLLPVPHLLNYKYNASKMMNLHGLYSDSDYAGFVLR